MAMTNNYRTTLTAREYEEFNQRKDMFEIQAQHELRVKNLELEVLKMEAKWSSLMRLPILIVKLPVLVLFGIAYICSMFTKRDLPPEFWRVIQ